MRVCITRNAGACRGAQEPAAETAPSACNARCGDARRGRGHRGRAAAGPCRIPAQAAPVEDIATEVGTVDPATGEIKPMSVHEVADALGGQVISVTDSVDTPDVPAASPAPVAPPAPAPRPTALPATSKGSTCEEPGCGKALPARTRTT